MKKLLKIRFAWRGSALIEMAVVVSFLLASIGGFWDTMMGLIAMQRHESAMIQLVSKFVEAPLKLQNNLAAGTARLREMTDVEADAYLDTMMNTLVTTLSNSGTGASKTVWSAMGEIWYFDINSPDDAVAPVPATGGYATAATEKGTPYLVATGETGSCFARPGIITTFDNLRDTAKTSILGADTATEPPIGTKIFETNWQYTDLSAYYDLKPYQSKMAFIFVVLCAKPPRLFSTSPVLSSFVIAPPKEAGFP